MSKHVGRNQRWSRRDAKTYVSQIGRVIYRQDAWYAELVYAIRDVADGQELPAWTPFARWLGAFKRPRNAMVELEREITVLRNRQVDAEIRFGAGLIHEL